MRPKLSQHSAYLAAHAMNTLVAPLPGPKKNLTWTEVTLPKDLRQKFTDESLSLAVCVPKSCAVEAVLAPYTAHPVVGFNYTEQYCRLPHDKPYVAADYVGTIVFSVIGMLTLISTAYELRQIFILRRDPEKTSPLLRTCSLYSNTRRLLTFNKPRALDCLDGIRSLSILVIIIFHTFWEYFLSPRRIVINRFELYQWLRKKRAVWMVSGDIAVDSFFTLSGLLLVYTSVNKMKQMSLLRNLHWFYLNRFLRLFPLLAAAVLLQASLLHRVADGPDWHYVAMSVDHCRRYWWSALLHIQNIANPGHTCVPWYLSVDMQLHIISPLVLFWVLGSRRDAWAALAAGLLASLTATLAFCYFVIYNVSISPTVQWAATGNVQEYMLYYNLNTLVRSPPFFIGMLFGYILHVFRGLKIELPQWIILLCHALSFATFFYVVYIVHPCMQADWDNHFADSMNNSFRRSGWSLALCWMILACVHGYGGPVNWFLSLRLWKFVARISYSLFLFHMTIQEIKAATTITPIYFNMETLFSAFASDLVYTTLLSTMMCIIVEEPALILQRMLLQGVTEPRQKQNGDEKKPVESIQMIKDEIYKYNSLNP
ncbi:nose resistant to fluoxetine protein 6-like [Choristoneura fumiferana]|uniref:nose resistant to fluoxetine protein 6-like n=1 Tax=Choristoneura fumiferana TaxID=7141 RepID=UPI003D15A47A